MMHRTGRPCPFAQDTGSYSHFLGRPPHPDEVFGSNLPAGPHRESDILEWFRVIERHHLVQVPERMDENPDIPAGYTYFGQLLAHDLTFDSQPLSQDHRDIGTVRNLRTPALDLDCIYGGGPHRSRLLYEVVDEFEERADERCRLRLGLLRIPPSQHVSAACPVFETNRRDDLARINTATRANNTPDPWRYDAPERWEALIADGRNEDNLILSQMQVLFHKFHNKVVDRIIDRLGGKPDHRTFAQARQLVVTTYQRIIVEDYLRRLLDPEVHQTFTEKAVSSRQDRAAHWASGGRLQLPIEFSQAAMRVGHFMVRNVYAVNALENNVTAGNLLEFDGTDRKNTPLSRRWKMDWSFFFDTGGPDHALTRPLPSKSIAPALAAPLFEHRSLKEPDLDGTRPDPRDRGGLMFQDLSRALESRLIAGQPLACALGLPVLDAEAIARHLPAPTGRWTDQARLLFSQRTPLLFYILVEAAEQHQGRRLGRLGSQILAEVIFAALHYGAPQNLPADFPKVEKAVTDPVGSIATMADLIRFASPGETFAGLKAETLTGPILLHESTSIKSTT